MKSEIVPCCCKDHNRASRPYLFSSSFSRNAPPDSIIEVDYEIELVHIVGVDELKQRMTVVVYVVEVRIENDIYIRE
jgi:hypothetical protein